MQLSQEVRLRDIKEGEACLRDILGRASQVALMKEMWVPSLGWEDPLEKGMATHSYILAWRIKHGQRSLVGYSS